MKLTQGAEEDGLKGKATAGGQHNGQDGQVEEGQAAQPPLAPVKLGEGFLAVPSSQIR
jgi:hypothetical protein